MVNQPPSQMSYLLSVLEGSVSASHPMLSSTLSSSSLSSIICVVQYSQLSQVVCPVPVSCTCSRQHNGLPKMPVQQWPEPVNMFMTLKVKGK